MADDQTKNKQAKDNAEDHTKQNKDQLADPSAKLTIEQFASEIRSRQPQLTPEIIDDSTLVRKVFERRPDLMQYVQSSEPRRRVRRGQQSDAADQIEAIMKGRKFEDLSYPERFNVLSLGFKEYATRKAKKSHEDTGLKKALDYLQTAAGVTGDVSTRISGAASDPKNVAIGATGLIHPIIPATYFFLDGATRAPGEVRKAIVDPSYDNLVSSGLTMTQILGSAEGMKPKGRAGQVSKEGRGEVGAKPSVLQRMGQEAVRTGPRMAEKLVRQEEQAAEEGAKTAADLDRTYTEKIGAEREKHTGAQLEREQKASTAIRGINENYDRLIRNANDNYNTKTAQIYQEYANNLAAREKAIAEAEAQHAQDVAKILEQHERAVIDAAHENKGEMMIEAHRQSLSVNRRQLADSVIQNVKNTHDIVRGVERADKTYPPESLNGRYDAWRDSVGGKDVPIPNQSRFEAIKKAREELAGTPPDLTIFNQIIKEITEKPAEEGGASIDASTVGHPSTERIMKESTPLDEYKTQTTALGEKAAASSGMARKALYEVYNASQLPLDQLSESKGVGDKYKQLKADYAQYMRDWHDTGVTPGKGVNSPLARLYRAIDPEKAVSIVTDKNTGERLYKDFDRYQGYGAAANNLMRLGNVDYELRTLPKPKYVPEPGKPSVPEKPTRPATVPPPTEKIAAAEEKRATSVGRLEEARGQKVGEAREQFGDEYASAERKHQTTVKRLEAVRTGRIQKALKTKNFDEMIKTLQEAKRERAAERLGALGAPNPHDVTMAAIATAGSAMAGHAMYALFYIPIRLGVMAAANMPSVEKALSRVTEKDVGIINDMYERHPEMKAEGQSAVTDLLIERAKNGKRAPNLGPFSKFLSQEQMGRVLRAYGKGVVGQPQEKRKPLDITGPVQSPVEVRVQ